MYVTTLLTKTGASTLLVDLHELVSVLFCLILVLSFVILAKRRIFKTEQIKIESLAFCLISAVVSLAISGVLGIILYIAVVISFKFVPAIAQKEE